MHGATIKIDSRSFNFILILWSVDTYNTTFSPTQLQTKQVILAVFF